jgi:hypothetical protein
MLTRETFNAQRAAAKRQEKRDMNRLALFAVPGGFAQLVFIQWADTHVGRPWSVRLEGAVFLIYAAIVARLLWRGRRGAAARALRCPHCATPLIGDSERVAAATGHCEFCGKQILAEV